MSMLAVDRGVPLPARLRQAAQPPAVAPSRSRACYRAPIGPTRPVRHRVCYPRPIGPPAPTLDYRLLRARVGGTFCTGQPEADVLARARHLGTGILITPTPTGLRVRRII